MLVLDVVCEADKFTERLRIDTDIECVTLTATRHAPPVECDRTLWTWIENHFNSENSGLDGE